MSRPDVDEYFTGVGEWMRNDIRREIELARASETPEGTSALSELGIPAGGGNLLAALGLVAYTEALGRLRVWNTPPRGRYGSASECFLAFFNRMAGGAYKAWWDGWSGNRGKSVYDVLRNGLVHEYSPKVDAEFWIGGGPGPGLASRDGVLIFRVAPYFRDFCAEQQVVRSELEAMSDPEVPPPKGTLPAAGAR